MMMMMNKGKDNCGMNEMGQEHEDYDLPFVLYRERRYY